MLLDKHRNYATNAVDSNKLNSRRDDRSTVILTYDQLYKSDFIWMSNHR